MRSIRVRACRPLSKSRGQAHPELAEGEFVEVPIQEQAYYLALELVECIDHNLTRRIRHYRAKSGQLLRELDEVIRAILKNDLMEEGLNGKQG